VLGDLDDVRWWDAIDRELAAVEAELDHRVPGFSHSRSRPRRVGGQLNTYVSFMFDGQSDRFETLLIDLSVGSARMSPDIDLPDEDERPVVLLEVEHGSGKVYASMYWVFETGETPSETQVEDVAGSIRSFLHQSLDVMTSLLEARRSLRDTGTEWVP
jgi:hypothetical protein